MYAVGISPIPYMVDVEEAGPLQRPQMMSLSGKIADQAYNVNAADSCSDASPVDNEIEEVRGHFTGPIDTSRRLGRKLTRTFSDAASDRP